MKKLHRALGLPATFALALCAFVSPGCSDSDSPTAPHMADSLSIVSFSPTDEVIPGNRTTRFSAVVHYTQAGRGSLKILVRESWATEAVDGGTIAIDSRSGEVPFSLDVAIPSISYMEQGNLRIVYQLIPDGATAPSAVVGSTYYIGYYPYD